MDDFQTHTDCLTLKEAGMASSPAWGTLELKEGRGFDQGLLKFPVLETWVLYVPSPHTPPTQLLPERGLAHCGGLINVS